MSEHTDDWLRGELREQCAKLLNGNCYTRRCLLRGGYSGRGPFDPVIATCEAKEAMDRLDRADALAARLEEATKRIRQFVEAYDGGHVELNSAEIDAGDPDIPPHPWHEEWLYHVRAFLEAKP